MKLIIDEELFFLTMSSLMEQDYILCRLTASHLLIDLHFNNYSDTERFVVCVLVRLE